MSNVIPQKYSAIDRVEIHLADGIVLYLENEEARRWAVEVDYGLREFYKKQMLDKGKVYDEFDWKREDR